MRRLAVELHGVLVGEIRGSHERDFDFYVTPEGIARYGTGSTVLSVAIPLLNALPKHHVARRRNWFAELLPEGDQYEYLNTLAGLRRGDTLGFLTRYGRDVAGAVQVWNPDDPGEPRTPQIRQVSHTQIRELLESPMTAPLANDPRFGKSSLAGVQPKIVLVETPEGWAQALDGFPTTHILKPQLDHEPFSIFDEEYGARLLRRAGMLTYDVSIHDFDGRQALVIERFDRTQTGRVHQEDFNQVLGASGIEKYQEYGGRVSLKRIADVLKRTTSGKDLHSLAKMTIAAVVVGNLDMHAKNLSMLHSADGSQWLAPAYDFVPMAHRSELDGKLALAVNKKYALRSITTHDLEAEIESWGVRNARVVVTETMELFREALENEDPLPGAHERMYDDIVTRLRKLLS